MDRTELIAIGDASVRKALANMFAILNKDGEMLVSLGGDRMAFSPRLECDGDCSAVLFDSEDKANGAIEEILLPQEPEGGYTVYRFTSLGDEAGDDGGDDYFEIECDDADCDGSGCDGDFEESEDGLDGGYEEIDVDDAIAQCREIASTCDDCECARQHEDIARFLEEFSELPDGCCESVADVKYDYPLVQGWVKRAKTAITDASVGLIKEQSRKILLDDAIECLRLLDDAFEDSKDDLGDVTFHITKEVGRPDGETDGEEDELGESSGNGGGFDPEEYVSEFKKHFGYRDDYAPTSSYRDKANSVAAECALKMPTDTAAQETCGDAVMLLVRSGSENGVKAGKALGDCMMHKGKHDQETLLDRMSEAYKALIELATKEEGGDDGGGESVGDDAEPPVDESVGKCPTMREAQRILKRNGYQLHSQRGSHQKWVKDGDPAPIILPYHSRDNEQVRPGDWKKIVKEHKLDLEV